MRYFPTEGVGSKEVPMPETTVILYAEDDGSVPLLTWLDQHPQKHTYEE